MGTSWNVFKNPPYDQLMASEWHKLFNGTDDHRKELTWRGRFSNVGNSINGTEVFNFYSSTEEVLRRYEGNLLTGGGFQLYCFVKQEKFKGTANFLAGLAGGSSDYCGWGFNMSDNNEDGDPLYYNVSEDGEPYVKHPDELDDIDSYDLIHKPFFKPNSRELFQDGASHIINAPAESQPEMCSDWIVKNATVRDWLLAKAFPALTLPSGANINGKFDSETLGHNFDMLPSFTMKDSQNNILWPRKELEGQINKPVWYHSDYKDIAYQYNHNFYKKIVDLTNEE